MSFRSLRSTLATLVFVASVMVMLFTAAPAALADTRVVTSWPMVEVEPGSEVTIGLEVSASPTQRVDLEVTGSPPGWETLLRGGGFVVRAVTAGSEDEPAEVDLELSVPPDASEGTHRVTVTARAADGTEDRLDVDLVVAEEVAGAVTLATEFPQLSGAADDTFRWSLDLDNALPGETTFALQAVGPAGWMVTARPSGEDQATTVSVEGGATETIEVRAEAPSEVEAGDYELLVVATGGGQRLEVPLVATVEGIVGLELATEDGRLNAAGTTGRATRVPLMLANTGSAPLEEVTLSSDPPAGWEVGFEPEQLEPIAPGETAELTAMITPADDAIAGDYAVGLTVEAQGRSDQAEVRFQVQTPTGWGAVGLGLIGLAVAGLGFMFRRYGRR